jgi:protein tyrosine phosphatase (PTP) superfamily phosphohydrolase (DUF442 family)
MIPTMIHGIINFLQISPNLGTAGQPRRDQFAEIKAAGYEVVINLALSTSTDALLNEQDLVTGLGMDYIHIPVVWEEPTARDLERFLEVMTQNQARKVFVHCALNMRVSVFIFLYRVLHLGVPVEIARQAMLQIWVPNHTWQTFIEDRLNLR